MLAGDFYGRAAVIGYLREVLELSGGTQQVVPVDHPPLGCQIQARQDRPPALEAGPSPEIVTGWINKTQAKRAG